MWTITKNVIVVLVENLETTLTQISKMIGLALEDMNQVTDYDERYFSTLGVGFFFLHGPLTIKLRPKQPKYRNVILLFRNYDSLQH